MGNIEEQKVLTVKQVLSIIGFVALSVFYGSWFYFSTNQLAIEHDADMMHIHDTHGADIEALEYKVNTIEERLSKKLRLLYEVEDRVVKLEK